MGRVTTASERGRGPLDAIGENRGGERGARILVVDDSATVQRFVAEALGRAGYEVRTAGDVWISGVVREFRPQLVLMDVSLGVSLRGTWAVEALRRQELGRAIRFVLYSSAPEEELRQLCLDCGADGYLPKDGDPERLRNEVHRLLQVEPGSGT